MPKKRKHQNSSNSLDGIFDEFSTMFDTLQKSYEQIEGLKTIVHHLINDNIFVKQMLVEVKTMNFTLLEEIKTIKSTSYDLPKSYETITCNMNQIVNDNANIKKMFNDLSTGNNNILTEFEAIKTWGAPSKPTFASVVNDNSLQQSSNEPPKAIFPELPKAKKKQ